jgi:ribosomal protein S18 acetylase RimI-like enzyme
VTFRFLAPGDAPLLAAYFRGLSAASRAFFGPHPLDDETAARVCAEHDPRTLRIVGVADGAIVAYAILLLDITEHEEARFRDRGLPLDRATDATVAPSVADALQGRGVGRALMEHAIDRATAHGRDRIVLLGGVQAANVRAVRLYERLGFVRAGEFEHPPGCVNVDMIRSRGADVAPVPDRRIASRPGA